MRRLSRVQYSQKIILTNLAKIGQKNYIPLQLDARIWYNPELKSAKFLVPGLVGFILAITGVIATSLSIVKEKERNTIEQIDVSPITSVELIVGKMIPYALISLVAATLVLTAAYFLFDVVIKGKHPPFIFCYSVVYSCRIVNRFVRFGYFRQPASCFSTGVSVFDVADDHVIGLYVPDSQYAVVAPGNFQYYTGKILPCDSSQHHIKRCRDFGILGPSRLSLHLYSVHVDGEYTAFPENGGITL